MDAGVIMSKAEEVSFWVIEDYREGKRALVDA